MAPRPPIVWYESRQITTSEASKRYDNSTPFLRAYEPKAEFTSVARNSMLRKFLSHKIMKAENLMNLVRRILSIGANYWNQFPLSHPLHYLLLLNKILHREIFIALPHLNYVNLLNLTLISTSFLYNENWSITLQQRNYRIATLPLKRNCYFCV